MVTGNIRMRLPAFLARAAGSLIFPVLIALPNAARGDDISTMLRYSYGNRSFPAGDFSTATTPGNTAISTQVRITGSTAVWSRFFSDYDLRYGIARRTRKQGGMRIVETRSGLQDQSIGIGYRFDTGGKTTQWLRVNAIIPAGSVYQSPKLSSGHWAFEPIYHLSMPGPWDTTVGFEAGPRIFTDGGSAQLRLRLQASKALTQSLRLSATIALYRSILFSPYNAATDNGEIGNFLRPGLQLQYRLHENLGAYIGYENYMAGKGGTASQRMTLGLSFTY